METEIIKITENNRIKVLESELPKLNTNTHIENIIKSHLEIIVLSLLYDRPMCGYDLIKEIFARYNVFLSQGTIYPLLYSMKEEGIVQAGFTKGDMRTKIYSSTQEKRRNIEEKISEFIKAEEYILSSIKKEFLYV